MRRPRLQQSADDPVVRISTLYRIKKEVFITVDYMGDHPRVSASLKFFVSGSHPVTAVAFYAQYLLWLTLAQRRKPLSSSWKGGGLSPAPLPPSVLLLLMQAAERGVENGLICLVTSVLLVTNAGSAPHPLEIG